MFDPQQDLEWVADPTTLFSTPRFRSSSWVRHLCGRAGGVFVTANEEVGQHGHFSTLFGVIVLRHGRYSKPVLHDLYVLHELTHRATLTYLPGRSWLEWSRALIASELESSLTSECYVYLEIPGLRAETFDHEIWVDRFFDGSRMAVVWKESVRTARLRALNTPDHDDYLEHQIQNYGRQNMQFCRIWALPVGTGTVSSASAFRVVDAHMSEPDWRDRHVGWLEEHSRLSRDGVPFQRQADEFGKVYEESVQKFGNRVLSA